MGRARSVGRQEGYFRPLPKWEESEMSAPFINGGKRPFISAGRRLRDGADAQREGKL